MRRSPGGDDLIPVLWLCGPPGVGKTAVGWEIFTQLTGAGIPAGYVDRRDRRPDRTARMAARRHVTPLASAPAFRLLALHAIEIMC
jgi:hypothetical protein